MTVVHTLSAYNTARGAENPLHSDAAARQLGYRAGLIGGVDMYGYLTYAAVARWGERWLHIGTSEVNLLKPVYEGDACDVVVTDEGGAVALTANLLANGQSCASAKFRLDETTDRPSVNEISYLAPRDTRPAATANSLSPGTVLPTVKLTQSANEAINFLADERDDLLLYAQRQLSHPGYLLRLCNYTLSRNFTLGPWIHTSSEVRNYSAVPVGASVQARARVAANYESRGHLMVDLDVRLVVDEDYVASSVVHKAIYRPRTGGK